jgi:pimeloyl-ACP methyl ester carboxylesterase
MIRSATLAGALWLVGPISNGLAQTTDTARVRAAYDSVSSLRAGYERSNGRFITVNGIRMHYLEWGAPNGVPLIWAHGSASNAYELRAVAPRLAQAGYRVLAVDFRGHGLTRVTNFDFSIYDIADDLIGLLDSLRIPAAVFGGSTKGGFVAAAVYEHYPNRVRGLLLADGGTWSRQWLFDRQTPDEIRRSMSDPIPHVSGASELEVFRRIVGNIQPGDLNIDWLFDMLRRIGPAANGEWAFLPDFDRLMGPYGSEAVGVTRPTTLPPLSWSEQAMIPRMVFRRLHVPMMILDPQPERDILPVTDQNERLAKDHPGLVTHRIYPQTLTILQTRPDWFVRDAVELLNQVRGRPR